MYFRQLKIYVKFQIRIWSLRSHSHRKGFHGSLRYLKGLKGYLIIHNLFLIN